MTRHGGTPNEAASIRRARLSRLVPRGPAFVRAHRWVALGIGFVLLVQCTAGAILLMEPEIVRIGHGERFHVTPVTPLTQVPNGVALAGSVTQGQKPLDAAGALDLVRKQRPDLGAVSAAKFRGVWLVAGDAKQGHDLTAYVDPGARVINAVGHAEPGFLRFLVSVHHCAFSCENEPGYQVWTDRPLIGEATAASLYLGTLGLGLVFLCASGLVIWWPTIARFASGFVVRRGRGAYVRTLDLHKLVGILSLPVLLMWGVSGAAFEFDWVEKAYYKVAPGSAPTPVEKPKPGAARMLTPRQAQSVALALHPRARVVGLRASDPEDEGGSYRVSLKEGFDALKDSTHPGQIRVTVDSHGGGVADQVKAGGPITEQYWENWQSGLHRGTFLPWFPRLLLALFFGLAPLFLGLTGSYVRLTRWRKNRARRAKERERAARLAARTGTGAPPAQRPAAEPVVDAAGEGVRTPGR